MLEDIKGAEEAALNSKKEATVTMRNILRSADSEANAKAQKLIDLARSNAKVVVANAEAKAKGQAKSLVEERLRQDRAAAVSAREHLPAAVAYIVEKVVV
ncbi:MAG: hypothetical protein RSE47_01850 [Acidaminococcaceae bacterium]